MREFDKVKKILNQKFSMLAKTIPAITRESLQDKAILNDQTIRFVDLSADGKLLSSCGQVYHLDRGFLEMRFDPEGDRPSWITPEATYIFASDPDYIALCAAARVKQMGYSSVSYVQESTPSCSESLSVQSLPEGERVMTFVDFLATAHLMVSPLDITDIHLDRDKKQIFIDLRTATEIKKNGMIPDAWHMPRTQLEQVLLTLSDRQKQTLSDATHIILYCATDTRSMLAYDVFAEVGMGGKCRPLRGGFQKWCDMGYPITRLQE